MAALQNKDYEHLELFQVLCQFPTALELSADLVLYAIDQELIHVRGKVGQQYAQEKDVKLRQDDVKLWNAAINPELHEIEVVQIYLAAFPKHRFQEGEVPFDRGFTLEILAENYHRQEKRDALENGINEAQGKSLLLKGKRLLATDLDYNIGSVSDLSTSLQNIKDLEPMGGD
ncbi:MAG: hypothetical protein MMC23_002606 [Stictis urceolatum]|nr:hypothetical protein [Stictis urceolata]